MAVSEEEVEKARKAAELTEEQMAEKANEGYIDPWGRRRTGNKDEMDLENTISSGRSNDYGAEDLEDYPLTPYERVESVISEARGHIARNDNPNLLRSGSAERLSAERPEPTAYDSLITGRDGIGPNDSHLKSVGDAADGGGTVVGTGMRLVDDPEWHKRYDAMVARKRAERAGLRAQAQARQELLDSGRYFVDAGGNVKLKKKFREIQRMDNTRRGWHKDVKADDGVGMRYIQKAGQDAYSGSMNGWQDALDEQNAEKASVSRKKVDDIISLNRQSLKNIEIMKAERDRNQARAKFNMVEGYMAAIDALNTKIKNANEDSYSPIMTWGQGKPDENGRNKSKWKYNENNQIIGQADAQPTGKYKLYGFVTGPTLQSLNQRIKEHGGDYQIVGLTATQEFNDVKGKAYGKPVVYARVKTFDEASGKPVYHDEVFTQERAYALGMEAGKAGEIDDYKNLVWQGVGDIHGEREREVAAANLKHKQNLELENTKIEGRLKVAEANNKVKAEIETANRQSREETTAKDREQRRELAAIRMAHERAMNGDKKADEDYKRIRELQLIVQSVYGEQRAEAKKQLDALIGSYLQQGKGDNAEKQAGGGTGETRKAGQKKIQEALNKQPTEQPKPTQGGGDKATPTPGDNGVNVSRTAQEIRANPQDGDELPLKGGGKARYNGKTKKWERAQ